MEENKYQVKNKPMKAITDFMMDLHKQLIEKRGVTESTASQILRSLTALHGGKPFTNLAWTKHTEDVMKNLEGYAESTQKTMVNNLVSALSLFKDKASYKKVHSGWYNILMEKGKEEDGKDTSKKTAKQEENWLSWDVVKGHLDRLKSEVDEFKGKKEITPAQWETLLSLVVLSLYTDFAPRRNQDYQDMYVVKKHTEKEGPERNYLVLEPGKFVFNKYKTAKKHGQQVFEAPKAILDVVKLYLRFHPLWKASKGKKDPVPLLVRHDGAPLTAVNAITRILNRVFGKRIGATALRHIYLSDKYDIKEMKDDAEKMAHTPGLQRAYMKEGGAQVVEIPTLQNE